MNEPQPPSSYPAPPPAAPPPGAKKKVNPLVWVALGCVGLIVVAAIIVAATGAFFARKVAHKFEQNPALAAAEMIVRMNPELELVDSDPDAGTLTIKNKKTGEEVTVNLDEVKEGRIRFESGDQESTVAFGGSGEEGALTVTDKEGKTTFRAGSGGSGDVPDWVPLYPGTKPSGSYRVSTAEGTSGAFTLTTGDSAEEVLDFYGPALEELGASVDRTTFSAGDTEGGNLSGGSADGQRKLTVTVTSRQGETSIVLAFNEKP